MSFNRLFVLAAGCGLLSVVACGGGSGDSGPDAAITPTGTHYGYVISKVSLPPGPLAPQVAPYSIDLGSPTSNKLDNSADNVLGASLATLATIGMFDIQGTLTEAVDRGNIILLADVQTESFTTAGASSFGVKVGATPTPKPCTDDADLATCGQHLKGGAAFTIASDSPTNDSLKGGFVNGTFSAGPGDLSLQIALGSTQPIALNLVRARIKATSVSDTGMTAIVGGLLLAQELNDHVLPAVHDQLNAILLRDCGPELDRHLPDCGCHGTGTLLQGEFDKSPEDCLVSIDEVKNDGLTAGLLMPDTCSTASCPANAADALSIGIKIEAVKASFPGLQ
jgi:hypothetical protein